MRKTQQTAGVKFDGSSFLHGVIVFTLILLLFATLYPVIYIVSMSISDVDAVLNREVLLLPKGFSLKSYSLVFENPQVWRSYMNTIFYTVFGTFINLALTLSCAYSVAQQRFFLRRGLMVFITLTMVFSGGMIPGFLLVTRLGIYNTRWAILLPGAVSAWNLIIARNFFMTTIPDELIESARIDGANDIGIFLKIVMPLSGAILAVMTLFYATGHWNMWFKAMIYVPNEALQPLQLYLRNVLLLNSPEAMAGLDDIMERVAYAMQLKFAVIVVATLPVMCLYPFVAKHFVKGVMVGAIKE
ncbi:MAG: carbohydrate ABC transporter permease [Treponema sp.]|jgi:putative aldouronate transport system permease protein|nr:carbohydrate ABC transporter permease [Treponema sp.]